MANAVREIIEWSAASLPLHGQAKTGDCFVVRFFGRQALVAVVDGVGHGEEAASAARLAAGALEEYTGERPLTGLLEECHQRLHGSRGAVISLALLNAEKDTLAWLGVGNIEGLLLRKVDNGAASGGSSQESLLLRAGVLGHILPRLSVTTMPLGKDDLLVFATDGIQPEFVTGIRSELSVQRIAQDILDRFALETDDALVLVVRYHEYNSNAHG
jgi:serine phosphatase RsbU (regulator of sigma subunit)